MSKQCYFCHKINEQLADDFYGDIRCNSCGVELSYNNPADFKPYVSDDTEKEEEEMGELAQRAKEKSHWLILAIGENSEPMIYTGWKEVTNQFGADCFRYLFNAETSSGLVEKRFDCSQQKFAIAMDAIPFGSKIVISRQQKLDSSGNPIERKSIYTVEKVNDNPENHLNE